MATTPGASGTPSPQPAGGSSPAPGPVKPPVQTAPQPAVAKDSAVQPAFQGATPFQIENVGSKLRYFKGLIYGDYGTGKTTLLGTASSDAMMRDVIIISAESGDMVLEADPENPLTQYFGQIDVIKTTDYKTIGRIYEFLKLHCFLRDAYMAGNAPMRVPVPGKEGQYMERTPEERLIALQGMLMPHARDPKRLRLYRTVGLDSLTETEVYCMNQLLGVNDATKLDEEVQGAEWGEFKKQHGMVQRLVRNFRDLPMHVLFTCSRAYIQNENKQQIYSPMMTGKLASQVQGFVDMVGYLVIGASQEEGKAPPRRMYVVGQPRFAAKHRFARFKGTHFDNPNIPGILRAVGLADSLSPPSPAAASVTAAPTPAKLTNQSSATEGKSGDSAGVASAGD